MVSVIFVSFFCRFALALLNNWFMDFRVELELSWILDFLDSRNLRLAEIEEILEERSETLDSNIGDRFSNFRAGVWEFGQGREFVRFGCRHCRAVRLKSFSG